MNYYLGVFMSILGMLEYQCPLCEEKFKYSTQTSDSIFGQYLDFKPLCLGEVPRPVPKCPKCYFVFSEGLFSENDINKVKQVLLDDSIFDSETNMPNYYYLAKEYELLEKDIDLIIHFYHCAIWEKKKLFFMISA